jgi:hypothetical protein
MLNEYVSLCTYHNELYAMTKDGKVYRIAVDDLTGQIYAVTLLHELPRLGPYEP